MTSIWLNGGHSYQHSESAAKGWHERTTASSPCRLNITSTPHWRVGSMVKVSEQSGRDGKRLGRLASRGRPAPTFERRPPLGSSLAVEPVSPSSWREPRA